jgi:hypothetical protein
MYVGIAARGTAHRGEAGGAAAFGGWVQGVRTLNENFWFFALNIFWIIKLHRMKFNAINTIF